MRKIGVICAALILLACRVYGTEDEYEDDHEDNVVEHPGPTFPSVVEVEEEVKMPTEGSSLLDEEGTSEDVIQTTTYPVFEDETITSTTSKETTLPPTSTMPVPISGSSSTSPPPPPSSHEPVTLPTTATLLAKEEVGSSTSPAPFLPPHQRPVRSDLASIPPPQGHEILVGNVTIYESPVVHNETFDEVMLISVHDIFGFHPHVKYISDRLSEYGFRTVVPDFFHGKPVSVENFPPPNFTETARYLFSKEGFWLPVKADLLTVMNYYRSVANVSSFGLYGFCWGAKMIVYASGDTNDFHGINAIGFVHPSRLVNQDANELNAPTILLPSNAEADLVPFYETLERRLGKGKSEHFRYDDMRHGFAGATSDFSNPDVRTRVDDVIHKLGTFFRRHLV